MADSDMMYLRSKLGRINRPPVKRFSSLCLKMLFAKNRRLFEPSHSIALFRETPYCHHAYVYSLALPQPLNMKSLFLIDLPNYLG